MTAKTYSGSCHCQRVRFEVTLDVKEAMACNCSLCARAGWLLAFTPETNFKLLSGEDALVDYQFNKRRLHHTFCGTCGVRPFSRGPGHDGTAWCGVNLRCLEGLDVEALPVKRFDGKSM